MTNEQLDTAYNFLWKHNIFTGEQLAVMTDKRIIEEYERLL